MKYLTIVIAPLRLKGDPDDLDTVREDVGEALQSMIEEGALSFDIQEDDEDEEDSNFD